METAPESAFNRTEDITKCSVCLESFTDPRSLPCVHTFCLKCIVGYGHDKRPGDKMPCPTCTTEFTVPPETGLNSLPKNLFIEKMLQIKQVSNGETTVVCEVCDPQSSNDARGTPASSYCIECQQKLCKDCAKIHGKYKMFRGHQLIGIESLKDHQDEEMLRVALPTLCQKHRDKTLDIYCNDCRTAVCVVCYIASHKRHNCSDCDDVVEEFREVMTADVWRLFEGERKLGELLAHIERLKKDLNEYSSKTEDEILKQADDLKDRIEENKQALVSELASKKGDVMKHLNSLSREVTRKISLAGYLKKYTEELSSKGATGDIMRDASVLDDRTEEVLKIDAAGWTRNRMESLNVSLTVSPLITGNTENLIGSVAVQIIPKGQKHSVLRKSKPYSLAYIEFGLRKQPPVFGNRPR